MVTHGPAVPGLGVPGWVPRGSMWGCDLLSPRCDRRLAEGEPCRPGLRTPLKRKVTAVGTRCSSPRSDGEKQRSMETTGGRPAKEIHLCVCIATGAETGAVPIPAVILSGRVSVQTKTWHLHIFFFLQR